MTKHCSTCKIVKETNMFSKNKRMIEMRNRNIKNFKGYPKTKTCNKCKKSLPSKEFHKKSWSSDGLHTECIKCKKEKTDKIKKEKIHLNQEYRKTCNKCGIKKDKNKFYHQIISKDKLNTICIDCSKIKSKKWRDENSDKLKDYRKNSLPKSLKRHKIRRQTDIQFRLLLSIRSRTNSFLKSKTKSSNTKRLIGCDLPFLKKWFEYQFNSKMNWENYASYWNIDHVKPCSSFNLQNENEQLECCNWKNLQPLESSRNCSKNNKIEPHQILLQELKVYNYKQHILLREPPKVLTTTL